jgi:hypothetical protein
MFIAVSWGQGKISVLMPMIWMKATPPKKTWGFGTDAASQNDKLIDRFLQVLPIQSVI